MKRNLFNSWLFVIVLIVGLLGAACSSSPSKTSARLSMDEIKKTVIESHSRSQLEKVTIVSVVHFKGYYAVKWERPSNCEEGTDYVNDQTGKIDRAETSIC